MLMIDFLQKGQMDLLYIGIATAERSNKNKKGNLRSGILLLQDNASVDTVQVEMAEAERLALNCCLMPLTHRILCRLTFTVSLN